MSPRTSPELRDECDADVLDSLRYLGGSTVAELVADTGRTRDQVLQSVCRLTRAGRAAEVRGWPRRWRAARGFGARELAAAMGVSRG